MNTNIKMRSKNGTPQYLTLIDGKLQVISVDPNGTSGGHFDDDIIIPCTVTEDIFHYAVHEGIGYMTTYEEALGNGAEFNISFKTPPVASNTYLHILYRYHGSNETRLTIQEGAVVTNETGTLHPVFNRNRIGTPNVTGVLGNDTAGGYIVGAANINGTITNEGTIINGAVGEHVGAGQEGGSRDASFEFNLAGDTVYVFKILNETANANKAFLELSWFEVPAGLDAS